MIRIFAFLIPLVFLTDNLNTFSSNLTIKQEYFSKVKKYPEFLSVDENWVDSVFNNLTQDEKIAQLLMIPVYSNKDEKYNKSIIEEITKYKPGGIIFMQGNPVSQVNLLNRIQQVSKVPVLVAMDAEWSLGMRLDNVMYYPRQMMLGAIQDNNIIYEMGAEFARQLKRVGVNVSFSPVCDVNNNPTNPVINNRSFGENKYNVAIKSYHYMLGLQDNKIIATAKHFPGHGDTNVDSHKSLPVIKHSRTRIDSLELYPFRYLFDNGIAAVMVAHLYISSLDSTPNLPSSLSKKVVTDLLKNDYGFRGLIFTDALNMGGVTNQYKQADAALLAILSGNDVLLFPGEIPVVIEKIKEAVLQGKISQNEIDERCKKILKAKYWCGLNNFEPIAEENLIEDLNNTEALLIKQKIVENGITLVTNKNDIIPINLDENPKIACLIFGSNKSNIFSERLKYYAKVDVFVYEDLKKSLGDKKLIDTLSGYDIIIIGIHNTKMAASSRYGISQEAIDFIENLAGKTKIILDIFANPYSLSYFKKINEFDAVIVSYEDEELIRDFSAQLILGGIGANAQLPVSAGGFGEGTGVNTSKIRLKYTYVPEDAGVDSKYLFKIDSIVEEGIKAKAFPGAQIVISRNGIVFFCKSYGYHTYDNFRRVTDFDLYDLASVTKVVATLPALMKLYDEEKFSLNHKLSQYLELLKGSNKQNFLISDILTHSAGFKSWIPFYKETIANNKVVSNYYRNQSEDGYSIKVAENLYLLDSFKDTILNRIIKSSNNAKGKYVYSDLGFYLFPLMIEKLTGEDFRNYLYDNFYKRLGCWTMTYLPLEKFSKEQIVPTEDDKVFRNQLLHGYVHDQGAAMLGGVSGHAGLFGSANDVAKLMQIFINFGKYSEIKFFSEGTVKLFTAYQHDPLKNRRGLGWDKPLPNDRTKGLGTKSASDGAYGHSGYTGTMVWADPHYDLVYVFNSNRVFPEAENMKIIKMNIRTDIEEIVYQAILSKNPDLKIEND
ncbi:MAG TPA: glycoside hydrolase family 3 N-terminal domain-containing protein [Bacteroidales bacterium]|nr:glycoside hydrolase family 3 N-terminal domain-containing protein [Bacteroidales bacterium]HOL97655.1 glycoside hydrolase family 3 N-terminal domain-containing protein [Bacteroidales bacterium]HOM37081.1 glycoside hydrolase family 3 N-terminal domain-containing protein [Bacteroidales bacterium]HPD24391.1 glycoside hydrolase family 3 N-terminal domain-containing protein [Bacteroidales bacterium]HRT00265.1 glycoside hydrolase family 3 N-terminal domain-containing protein [Bacteroidales bacteri